MATETSQQGLTRSDRTKGLSGITLPEQLRKLRQDLLSATTPEAVKTIVFSTIQQALAIEANRDPRNEELYGFDSLTTDTQGGRPAEWFAQKDKVFSLGVASYCIVVGLFNEKIGIAGSHRKSNTEEAAMEALGMKLNIREDDGISITNEERLQQTIQITAQEALEEFSLLSPNGIPAHGTQVFAYGLFASQLDKTAIYDGIVEKTIKSHPSIKERGVNLELNSNIGTMGQLAYGGETHPQYSVPTFIPFYRAQNSSI